MKTVLSSEIITALAIFAFCQSNYAGDVPTAEAIVQLGKSTQFDQIAVTDHATESAAVAAEAATKSNPNFAISVNFSSENIIDVDPKQGAVVAMIDVKGIPAI